MCGICGKFNKNWLCENCLNKLKNIEKFEYIYNQYQICNLFNYKFNAKLLKNEIYFDEIMYCFEYKGIIRKLLLQYKFFNKSYISNMFAQIILNSKKVNEILKKYDIIIPVPMDRIKKSQRGYNQTELILKVIKKLKKNEKYFYKFDVKINYKILIKRNKTKTQSTLNLEDRKKNVTNAYFVKNNNYIFDKKIVIFDDICTTGATVNEISKKLKEAGAKKILVFVIAKD